MALLNFKHGFQANLKVDSPAIEAGTVYITRDERAMYVDLPPYEKGDGSVEAAKRIRIGDMRTFDYLDDLRTSISNDMTELTKSALFYAEYDNATDRNRINALLKWNGSEFIQLNTTSELSANLAALEGKINTAETNITTLQGQVETLNGNSTTAGSVDYKIAAAVADLNTAIGTKANQSDLETLSGTVEQNKNAADTRFTTVESNISNNAGDVKDLQDLVGTESVATQISAAAAELNETINTKASQTDLNNLSTTVTNNKNAVDTSIQTINETLGEHTTAIGDLQDLIGGENAKSVADQISEAVAAEAQLREQADATHTANISSNAGNIERVEGSLNTLSTNFTTFKNDVESNYLKSGDAADTYLTKTDAGNTYATKTELNTAKSDLLGTSTDSGVATIHGALNKANEVDTKLTTTNSTLSNLSQEVTNYKTSNDSALAAVKATADAAATNADLQAEIARAQDVEGDLLEAINTETTNRQTDIAGLDGRLDVVEVFLTSVDNDTEIVDTLKEIQEYIASDETGAAAMAASIQSNTQEITTIKNTYALQSALNTEITERQNDVAGAKTYTDTKLTWTQF